LKSFFSKKTGGKDMVKISIEEIVKLKSISRAVRLEAVKMVGRAGTGHIGGSLSCIDLLVALYFNTLNIDPEEPKMSDRDRFVLCKGHATPAVYAVLAERGFFPKSWLETFDVPLSNLPKHVDMHATAGIEMSTGALGQGLSVAIGMALAARLNKQSHRIFALLSDGENQSGQTWESAMAAPKFSLDNLTAIIDRNKLQVDGASDTNEKIMPLEPLVDKWRSFGWNVIAIDGHDFEQILDAYRTAAETKSKPTMIVADTVKGKGVSFMENNVAWHHKNISKDELDSALTEIEQG
jgi:transketolase